MKNKIRSGLKTEILHIRLTVQERKAVDQMAEEEGLSLSDFFRVIIRMKMAEKKKGETR